MPQFWETYGASEARFFRAPLLIHLRSLLRNNLRGDWLVLDREASSARYPHRTPASVNRIWNNGSAQMNIFLEFANWLATTSLSRESISDAACDPGRYPSDDSGAIGRRYHGNRPEEHL